MLSVVLVEALSGASLTAWDTSCLSNGSYKTNAECFFPFLTFFGKSESFFVVVSENRY